MTAREPLELAPEGDGHRADADLLLGIPRDLRPFCDGPAVLSYYDGPLLMVLSSPLLGDLLALALPDEAGPWPFLLTPINQEQVQALGATGVRSHLERSQKAYLLRDYGAQDLVAAPLQLPLPEEWLPSPGY